METNGRITHKSEYGGLPDPILSNQIASAIANTELARNEFFNRFSRGGGNQFGNAFEGQRNLNEACGYPTAGEANIDMYRDLYDWEPIAERAVELYAREAFKVTPTVYEDEESDNPTEFEKAWDELSKQIMPSGHESWYEDEKGSKLWSIILRATFLCRIGTYGILLLGIDDGKLLQEPADGIPPDGMPLDISGVAQSKDIYGGASPETPAEQNPLVGTIGTDAQYFMTQFTPGQPATQTPGEQRKLLFLRAYDQSLVQVVQYEANIYNPRFGQPIMYLVTINDPRQPHTGVGLPLATLRVHWSRIIHIADNLKSSEIFGKPEMQSLIRPILDIAKVRGGSAEMYWQGAFMGLSFETHPQLGGDVLINAPQMREQIQQYQQRLQRYLLSMGMTAKTLAPQVVDPTSQIEVQTESICIKLACPIRVFKGSERGEQASTQDDSSWNDRVKSYQSIFISPQIIAPLVDRLIVLGILPEPKQFHIEWPDLDAQTDLQKAQVGLVRTQALGAFISGGCEATMSVEEWWTKIMQFDEEVVEAMTDSAPTDTDDFMTSAGAQQGDTTPPPPPIIGVPGMTTPSGKPPQPGQPGKGPPGAKPPGAGGGGAPLPKGAGQPAAQPPKAPVTHSEEIDFTINPFVSEQQRRACYAKDDPNWDCDEWNDVTPKGKKLPKYKSNDVGSSDDQSSPSTWTPRDPRDPRGEIAGDTHEEDEQSEEASIPKGQLQRTGAKQLKQITTHGGPGSGPHPHTAEAINSTFSNFDKDAHSKAKEAIEHNHANMSKPDYHKFVSGVIGMKMPAMSKDKLKDAASTFVDTIHTSHEQVGRI